MDAQLTTQADLQGDEWERVGQIEAKSRRLASRIFADLGMTLLTVQEEAQREKIENWLVEINNDASRLQKMVSDLAVLATGQMMAALHLKLQRDQLMQELALAIDKIEVAEAETEEKLYERLRENMAQLLSVKTTVAGKLLDGLWYGDEMDVCSADMIAEIRRVLDYHND